MSEHIINQNTETVETTTTIEPQYTVEYILTQIAEIQNQTLYLFEALAQFSNSNQDDFESGSIPGQAGAKALAEIVRCRETTNQQMLSMYEKMLDRLTEKDETANQLAKMTAFTEWAKTLKLKDCDPQMRDVICNAVYEKLQNI